MGRPNFLIFVADQMRYDLMGCAGHPCVQTPNIDSLAAEGVRFERCYTVQPMCMATRSTWLTGRTPRGHGVRCNGIPLNQNIPTITAALADNGYRTHSVGKIHANLWFPQKNYDLSSLNPEEWPECLEFWNSGKIKFLPLSYYGFQSADILVGKSSGDYRKWVLEREPDALEIMTRGKGKFESVEHTPDIVWKNQLPPELHTSSWASESAERFLDGIGDENFFLWCSIPDPHPPYTVADPYFSMYNPADMPKPNRREGELDDMPPHYKKLTEGNLFTAGRIKSTDISDTNLAKLQAAVCGMMTQWDAMVGRVMKKLREKGLAENTVVVVMSDHGQMLGDHWMLGMPPTHLDGTLRVPSVWSCPERFSSGATCNSLVSHLDSAPTVLELAGIPFPQGDIPPSPEVERQMPACPGKSFLPLLTGETEKIQDSVIAENDADYLALRQRTLVTENYHITFYPGKDYGELFDLKNDPSQLYNLWNDPKVKYIKNDLLVQMLERFAETDSVLPRRLGHA